MCYKVHKRGKDALWQCCCAVMKDLSLRRPNQPAQSYEMSDAHQCISKGLRVHCTYFTIIHSPSQVPNIALADLSIVVEEGIRRDPFRLLDDTINAPMLRHKGEERFKPTLFYLQTTVYAHNGSTHARSQAFPHILDQFCENFTFTMKVNVICPLRHTCTPGYFRNAGLIVAKLTKNFFRRIQDFAPCSLTARRDRHECVTGFLTCTRGLLCVIVSSHKPDLSAFQCHFHLAASYITTM